MGWTKYTVMYPLSDLVIQESASDSSLLCLKLDKAFCYTLACKKKSFYTIFQLATYSFYSTNKEKWYTMFYETRLLQNKSLGMYPLSRRLSKDGKACCILPPDNPKLISHNESDFKGIEMYMLETNLEFWVERMKKLKNNVKYHGGKFGPRYTNISPTLHKKRFGTHGMVT